MSKPEKILQILHPSKFDAERAANFDLARANGKLRASTPLDRVMNVDAEKRTADFAFASNKPIEHWFGFLILDTNKNSVNLDRVTSGVCPHLVNHDTNQQVGVVVADSVTLDDMVRGTVKFSQSPKGKEIFQDVIDEIRMGVSFGFLVHDMILESEEAGVPTYRATKWEIIETTSASIAADISVGFGRNLDGADQDFYKPQNTTETRMEENELETTANAPAAAPAVTQSAQTENRSQTQSADFQVAREISDWGDLFGERDLAQTYITERRSVEDFRTAVAAKRAASTPIQPVPAETAAQRQGENVQLARSIYRGGELKAFRGKDGLQTAHRMGMWLGATLFGDQAARDFCTEKNILMRTQTGSKNELGGFLVPDEFENVMIDLRILYGIFRANANVVPMSSDTKRRPRRTGGLTAYPVGNGLKGQKSEATWDAVELIARKWMALAKYEEDFSEDAVINTADTLASEIAYAFAQVEDDAGFNGDGTSKYHGIIGIINRLRNPHNASTLPAVANVGGLIEASGNIWDEITEADLLKVVGRLPQFARRSGSVKWYCSNEFWAQVLERIALAKGGVTYKDMNGDLVPVFLGKPVEIVEVMPHTEENSQIPLIYGNLSQSSMFGDRRGISVKSTDSNDTDFEEDVMTIKGSERFDINNHDAGNVSATAKERKAGPVVGLITKSS